MSNMLDALKASGFSLSEEAEKEAELSQSSMSEDYKDFLPFSVNTFDANEFKKYSKVELEKVFSDEPAYAGGDSAMEEYKRALLRKKKEDEQGVNQLLDSEYSFLAEDLDIDEHCRKFSLFKSSVDKRAIDVINLYKEKIRVVNKFIPESTLFISEPYMFYLKYYKYRKGLKFEAKYYEISKLAEDIEGADKLHKLRKLVTREGILGDKFLEKLMEESPYIPLLIDDDTFCNYEKKDAAKVLLGKDIRGYQDYEEKLKGWFEQGGVINPNVWYICRFRKDGGMYLQRDLTKSPRKTN